MAAKLFALTLLVLVVACVAHASVLKVNKRSLTPSPLDTQEKLPRRNFAYAVSSKMPADRLRAGLDRLQYLLDYNTKNKELLLEMNKHFQQYKDLNWHLVLEETTAGVVPQQYAYYRFDRNNTELFVAGYSRC